MVFAIALVTLLLISAIQVVIPYFVKRTLFFGVTIPEQYRKDEKLQLLKRGYVKSSFIFSIVIIVSFIFWVMSKNPADERLIVISTVLQFIIIFISFALYFYYHKKTKNYKKEMGWTEELKEVAVADLKVRLEDNMPPWYIYFFPIVVVIGLIVYTFAQYELLPNKIPTHWGFNGEPDAFTEKTPFSVIQLLIVLLIMQCMFLFIQIAMKNSGIKLSATNLKASKKRQTILRNVTSWFLFYTVILITILFAFLHLQMIHPNLFHKYVLTFLPLGVMFGILGGTVVLLVKVGFSDKYADVFVTDPIMDKDEDQYWKGGLFYFNKNDPSIFVEKRFGVGWTMNFANPKAYFILLGPIVLIVVISLL